MAEPEWMKEVRALVGKEYGRVYAWDPVNAPMIRHWCEVMGVENPAYTDAGAAAAAARGGLVAPATMLQVWCLEGLKQNNYPPGSTTENPYESLKLIEAQGYPSVVAVNSDLEFERELHLDERLYYTTRLDAIGEEKTTALGTGFFVTLLMTYWSQREGRADEKVGAQLFRVFKFKPANPVKPAAAAAPSGPPKIKRPAPGISDDTRFFWEGARAGKLLIQRCKACGTLRHPPGPVCTACHSFEWDTVESQGLGRIHSFVVMHYPEVPPFEHPNPIALVDLDEGTRLVAQLVGVAPGEVAIGQRVKVEFATFETSDGGDIALPQFRPLAGAPA
ncbi:MAG TPA: bifunctional MaoC family dehydratase N-terminal/OB-fold nucleic acid binding domain-containing protein [Rubrivivax sp.]|nr:bifunctional MaoC family dehydratase N-terminal/OB-fold nucleic acid binding domain-containing protein [Rubrivivax sp.]